MSVGLPSIGIGLSRIGLDAAVRALFAAGEQGGWWDPSDFSTMFQDNAGTTPVTAAGQSVGKILDKSGRGNHATQSVSSQRPVLQKDASGFYHLAFDGVNNMTLVTASIDLTGTSKLTALAGVLKNADVAQLFVELSAVSGATNPGSFNLGVNAGANWSAGGAGSTPGTSEAANGTTFTAPVSNVVTGLFDWTQATVATQVQLRVNGVTPTIANVGTASSGSFGNFPLFIGSRGGTSFPLNGRLYSVIVRGAASSASQLALSERYVGAKMGIAL